MAHDGGPVVLVTTDMEGANIDRLISQCDVCEAANASVRADNPVGGVRALYANYASAREIDRYPDLEIIANFGVGYDGIDVGHAAARGIVVTNTPDVLTEETADTAVGLLLNTAREFSKAEAYLRAGLWESKGPFPLSGATLRGRHAGIFGLGRIGMAIARRLEAFQIAVSYHGRSRKADVTYPYHASLISLAESVDTLIVAAPGKPELHKAVNADVLSALGPNGILVNIGRGSLVDECALIEALREGTILGAGLDVFEREPHVPPALLELENTFLLPHVGSASAATRQAMSDLAVDNILLWLKEKRVITPVPESLALLDEDFAIK